MTLRPLALGVLVLVATALVADPARAQPLTERGQAAAHVRQAQAYFQRGDFDRALAEYQAAFDLAPEPGLLFNIGLCHDRANRPEPALEAFRRYIALAPNGVVADEARSDIARLTPIVEKLALDRQADQAKKTADEEQRKQDAQRKQAAERAEAETAHGVRVAHYVMLAGAVIAVGGATSHYLSSRIRDRLPTDHEAPTYLDERDRFRLEGRIAVGAYAVGAITIATGVVLAYRARNHREAPEVSAALLPGGAAMTLTWSR
jgi:tetratricopeptide (TPR) repeat protein